MTTATRWNIQGQSIERPQVSRILKTLLPSVEPNEVDTYLDHLFAGERELPFGEFVAWTFLLAQGCISIPSGEPS